MISNEKDSKAFEGKAVIVTGAAKGIGRATALAFSQHGARVVMVDIAERELKVVHGIIQPLLANIAISFLVKRKLKLNVRLKLVLTFLLT